MASTGVGRNTMKANEKMKLFRWVALLFCLLLAAWISACDGGSGTKCEPNSTKICQCGDKSGTQTCKEDGTYADCECAGGSTEPADEPKNVDEPAAPQPEPVDEPAAPAPDEPASSTPDEPLPPTPDAGTDAGPKDDAPVDTKVNCQADEFEWQGACYTKEAFCTSTTSNSTFPMFSQAAMDAMQKPYEVEFDIVTGRPMFCQTKEGYYYLNGSGYGPCDNDGDGWLNIEAYRAVTSTDKQIQNNARCILKKVEALVYHAEQGAPQIQTLAQATPLVETSRNDGLKDQIEMPVYTNNQATVPKTKGGDCTQDSDCTVQGEVCYNGHCLAGRRFQASEINTFTKACISGIDLNDNQLDDASETPSDTPTPNSEFKPLLNMGYFMELHYGYHQADYDNKGTKIPVYHVHERKRTDATDKQGLALKCQESQNGFDPDYWKICTLKDDQQCEDPSNPGTLKKGLSHCWMKDVKQMIPSLFKCVVHDNTTDKTTKDGHFHPDNYGFSSKYNRTRCKVKGALTSGSNKDLEFECSSDDGNQKPDPSKKEVGWACVSFQSYSASADYLAGCVDQKAEKVCGDTKDGKAVTYVTLEAGSYGLVRAKAQCGQSNGKGVCDFAQRVCTGGKWLDCDKCDHCPQDSTGSKATCPNGVWPTNSCMVSTQPSSEKCDGLDNDCNGQIDDGLNTNKYYLDNDKDNYPDQSTFVQKCNLAQAKVINTKYIAARSDNKWDCNDNNNAIKPGVSDTCDGVDNDCDNSIDENASKLNYYKDNDGDSYGKDLAFKACVHKSDSSKLCKGKNDCVSKTYNYTSNGSSVTRTYTTDSQDCCDSDSNAKPGQSSYFASKNNCGSWDYNCNGSTDKNVNTCSCSKSFKYTEKGTAKCAYDSKWDSTGNWASRNRTNYTITNSTKCEVAHTFSFGPSSDFNFKYTCSARDLVNKKHTCTKTATADKSQASATYTPKSSDGSSTLMIIHKNNYKSGCVFKDDGSTPGCGEIGLVAPGSTSLESAPSFSDKNAKFNSGSHQCDPCGICSACKSDGYKCTYEYNVTLSSDYKYFKRPSTQQQVKCR